MDEPEHEYLPNQTQAQIQAAFAREELSARQAAEATWARRERGEQPAPLWALVLVGVVLPVAGLLALGYLLWRGHG